MIKINLNYILSFLGFFFTLARVIRNSEIFLIISFISIGLLIIRNYKVFIEPELKIVFKLFGLFIIWIFITSLWAESLIITIAQASYFLFILAFATLLAYFTIKKQISFFEIFLITNTILIVLNTFSLISDIPSDAWTANHGRGFTGIFKHQNSFASALLFTLPGVISFLFYTKFKDNLIATFTILPDKFWNSKGYLFYLSVVLVLNIYFIIITHSRATVLAFVVGLLVFVFITYKNYSRKAFLIYLFLLILLPLLFYKPISEYALKDYDNLFSTREVIWGASFDAAKQNLIFGCGFGNSTQSLILSDNASGSKFVFGQYFREKGNGILAIIEETGIVGLLFFSLPFLLIIKKNRLILYENIFFVIIISFLFAFFVHIQFEAWIVSFFAFPRMVTLSLLVFFINSGKTYNIKLH